MPASALYCHFDPGFVRQDKPAPRPLRVTVNAPEGAVLPAGARPAISPDGEKIVFPLSTGGQVRLYLYNLVTGDMQPVAGVDGSINAYWSFDSRSFLVPRGNTLAKVNLNGGAPEHLPLSLPVGSGDANAFTGYLSWGPEGIITSAGGELQWFRPDGSRVKSLHARHPGEAVQVYPTLIPGSRWVMYNGLLSLTAIASPATVHLVTLDGKAERTLFKADSAAIYATPGYALYLRGSTLMARPIDPSSGELQGEAVPIVENVGPPSARRPGSFSVSANGVLVYSASNVASEAQLVWFDRAGKQIGTLGDVASYTNPALSPDGKRLAISILEPRAVARDIWVFDLDSGTPSKLTFDPQDDLNPVWSPDGLRIAFSSNRRGKRDLYIKSAFGAGGEELLLESELNKSVEDWSRDGRLVYNQTVAGSSNDLWTLSLDTRRPQPFAQEASSEDQARFSPDGKWIAYHSSESGRFEVYVRPFSESGAGGKWVISNAGGAEPQWRADGKELFYAYSPDSTNTLDPTMIMAVDIGAKDGALVHGTPRALFETRLNAGGRSRWVVTPDGKKFLTIVPREHKAATSINVIVNWPSLLRR